MNIMGPESHLKPRSADITKGLSVSANISKRVRKCFRRREVIYDEMRVNTLFKIHKEKEVRKK
jgi:hypothetical protein